MNQWEKKIVGIKGINNFHHFVFNALCEKLLRRSNRTRGLFRSTNIETFGHCNRKCSFCFNNDRFPSRDEGIMDENLYFKIIDELSELKFHGRISPHFYGEPLLDRRILRFVSYARKRCPDAYIRFGSNGDLLSEKLLKELIENGLDSVRVSNYDDFEKKNLIKLSQNYPGHITYREFKNKRTKNRAGRLFARENKKINEACLRPSKQLVINWKGNILLCCNDYYEKFVWGNVKNKSILKIWNTEEFKKYREILSRKGGREKIHFCRNCDV